MNPEITKLYSVIVTSVQFEAEDEVVAICKSRRERARTIHKLVAQGIEHEQITSKEISEANGNGDFLKFINWYFYRNPENEELLYLFKQWEALDINFDQKTVIQYNPDDQELSKANLPFDRVLDEAEDAGVETLLVNDNLIIYIY